MICSGKVVTSNSLIIVMKTSMFSSIGGQKYLLNVYISGITEYVDEFLGIPFAAPPIGSRRWQVYFC